MSTNKDEHVPGNADKASDEQAQTPYAALYDRFSDRVRELFEASQEKSKEAMDKAMETARQQFSAAGEFTSEQGEVFKQFMRRDLQQTAEEMRTLQKEAAERLNPARVGAGALSSMSHLLEMAGSALQTLSQKAEDALRFRTGELTSAGTLTCKNCGHKIHLKRTAHIPPCPNCNGSDFRKGY
jgi:isocitrate dehydrogenase